VVPLTEPRTYVTRAGDKLAFALAQFGLNPTGLICADLGCHAGGFTDCLLQHGAARVYSVDTGHNILDWKLRNDARVVMMERTNALHLILPEPVDLVTVDVGWTPQRLVIPVALGLIRPGGTVISLLKPHYEASQRERAGGRVRPEALQQVVERTVEQIAQAGGTVEGIAESPVRGGKGHNTEYVALIRPAAPGQI
jgi:23S rRNA (cytidine1920-2'-O)/16S rRNA (cytidine1409-2'-O)-methyltransferase